MWRADKQQHNADDALAVRSIRQQHLQLRELAARPANMLRARSGP
jgi:hypothetical protein